MALMWANEARNNLSVASNNYAKLQREIDKYNKIFQAYALASPETQIRAASVMRQAINEYNSLKAQQENNALKIYQAQNLVDYYNNTPTEVQPAPTAQPVATELNVIGPWVEIDTGTYQEEPVVEVTPVLDNTTPWSSNIAYVTNEQNAMNDAILNNTQTVKYLNNLANQNRVKYSSVPASVQKMIDKQAPKYANTNMTQATTQWTRNITTNPYWQWNVNTWGVAKINSNSSLVNTGKSFGMRQRRFK